MEERIIDDEYGRGIRMKKTKDGYVDVTDELAPETDELDTDQEMAEDEVAFEFPMMDMEEDDEDLVGLSNEEAEALRQKKAEEAAKRKAEYERLCAEGEAMLAEGSFRAAERSYEKALKLDELATVASVGYWRAKTENFENPDVLIDEYAEEGIESLEYDLGIEATEVLKRDFRPVFEKRLAELQEEEKPLAEEVEGKQERRHDVLSARLRMRTAVGIVALVPFLVCLLMTAVFGMQITATRDATGYVIATSVMGGVSFLMFLIFLVCLNNFLNALRIYRKNENLASTEEGVKLLGLRAYMELCESLLAVPAEEETDAGDLDEKVEDEE